MSVLPTPDEPFDLAAEVVVVGAGAAGFAAALAARDAGAEVLLLERDPVPRGSTSMSQGYVCAAGTRLQRDAGIADEAETFFADIMARTKGKADPRIARAVADNAGPTIDWLVERHAIPFRMNNAWGNAFGRSANRQHGVPSRTGEELHNALMRAAEDAGIDLVTNAHVAAVFADGSRVTGVAVRRGDGTLERIGCRALVLTTCGFGANHAMVKEFIPAFGSTPYYRYWGHEGNEGEGIRWGIELGAAVGCMDAFQGYGALADPYGIIVNYDMVLRGAIMVNLEGERFSDETAVVSGQSLNVLRQPERLAWIVFDDARRALVEDLPEFRELAALGAVKTAADADAVAAVIKVPADALRETLADTARMAAGAPCPFGRDFTRDAPLTGRLHAIRVTGALFHTQGGLMIDEGARVLRPDGTTLPNLFAGGGTACSISGHGVDGYLPAAGLCTALTLGRLAGASAAAVSAPSPPDAAQDARLRPSRRRRPCRPRRRRRTQDGLQLRRNPLRHPRPARCVRAQGRGDDARAAHRRGVPNSELGQTNEMINQTQSGINFGAYASTAFFNAQVPLLGVTNLPFVFKDRETAFKVIDGEIGETIKPLLEERGIVVLGFMELGFRHITNSKRQILAPADLAGLKIRLQSNPVHIETFKLFGASPVALDGTEIFSALQQGVVDGQENLYSVINNFCLYDAKQKYLTETGHFFDIIVFAGSKRMLDAMTPEDRAAVIEAGRLATLEQRRIAAADEAQNRDFVLSKGVQTTVLMPEQRDAFRTASLPVYDTVRGMIDPAFVDKFLAAVDAAN